MSLFTRAEATWPQSQSDSVPALAGFVVSAFSPLVAHIAARCLEQVTATERTAVIIVSATGDLETAEATAKAVDAGQRPGPLLFYQAVPNAVAGYIAAKHGLAGPVICLGPQRPGLDEGLAVADLLIRDGDAEEALIISVEQAMVPGGTGNAIAVLVKGGN